MGLIKLSELFELPNCFNPSTTEGLKALKEYEFLLKEASEAAFAFLAQDFSRFDPNIGDCACQIRSVKTILLARNGKVIEEMQGLMERSEKVQEACRALLEASAVKKAQPNPSIPPKLALTLSEEVAYLVQAYIFTLTHRISPPSEDRPLCVNGKIVPAQLSALSGDRMTKSRANKMSSLIRRNLSAASLEFIRKEAELSGSPLYMRACSPEFTQNFDTIFFSVPMFYSYQVLLETCRREAIPVVFKIKLYDKDLPIESRQIGTQFVRFGATKRRERGPFCVFEGVRQDSLENLENLRRLCNNTLACAGERVILAGAADHPQYAKKEDIENLEDLEADVPETLGLKQFSVRAKAAGCSMRNPSLFFIQHVYPQAGRFLMQEGCPGGVLEIEQEGVIDV